MVRTLGTKAHTLGAVFRTLGAKTRTLGNEGTCNALILNVFFGLLTAKTIKTYKTPSWSLLTRVGIYGEGRGTKKKIVCYK